MKAPLPALTKTASQFGSRWLVHVLFAACLYRMVVPEMYHRMSERTSWAAMLMAGWLLATLGMHLPWLGRGLNRGPHWERTAVLALMALLWLPELRSVWGPEPRDWVWGPLLWLAVGSLALLGLRCKPRQWLEARRVIGVAATLFVLSEPVIAHFAAPALRWPPLAPTADVTNGGSKAITVVLLLDELNASDSGALRQVLTQHGLPVQYRAVVPIGDATSKVLPAMFTGHQFSSPRPCSPAAICSGSQVLDFSEVTASRPDVDIVGFYHPYCRMKGLRSCVRATVHWRAFEPSRLRCALWRRIGKSDTSGRDSCTRISLAPWFDMVDETLEAVNRAPVWTRGGLLFAHLPLPHPPSRQATQSLQDQYKDNLERSADFLERLVVRGLSTGRALNIVVSSDHPLRMALHCAEWPYSRRQCDGSKKLADDRVPLVVSTAKAVDLSALGSNQLLFNVLSQLPS